MFFFLHPANSPISQTYNPNMADNNNINLNFNANNNPNDGDDDDIYIVRQQRDDALLKLKTTSEEARTQRAESERLLRILAQNGLDKNGVKIDPKAQNEEAGLEKLPPNLDPNSMMYEADSISPDPTYFDRNKIDKSKEEFTKDAKRAEREPLLNKRGLDDNDDEGEGDVN